MAREARCGHNGFRAASASLRTRAEALAFAIEHPQDLAESMHLDGFEPWGSAVAPGSHREAPMYVLMRWLPVDRHSDGGYLTFERAFSKLIGGSHAPPSQSSLSCKAPA